MIVRYVSTLISPLIENKCHLYRLETSDIAGNGNEESAFDKFRRAQEKKLVDRGNHRASNVIKKFIQRRLKKRKIKESALILRKARFK